MMAVFVAEKYEIGGEVEVGQIAIGTVCISAGSLQMRKAEDLRILRATR